MDATSTYRMKADSGCVRQYSYRTKRHKPLEDEAPKDPDPVGNTWLRLTLRVQGVHSLEARPNRLEVTCTRHAADVIEAMVRAALLDQR
jgi:hypothetical protein